MIQHLRSITITLMLCATFACSTAHKNASDSYSDDPTKAIASAHEISFEIGYSLGNHGHHRLAGSLGGDNSWSDQDPRVATYLEREVIDEGAVRSEKYRHFVEKIFSFTQTPQRTLSQEGDCRSPFSITLKIDGKTYTSKGCRTSGEGSFGALVREGEFLLYSKK
jgi:hypothetical protein